MTERTVGPICCSLGMCDSLGIRNLGHQRLCAQKGHGEYMERIQISHGEYTERQREDMGRIQDTERTTGRF